MASMALLSYYQSSGNKDSWKCSQKEMFFGLGKGVDERLCLGGG